MVRLLVPSVRRQRTPARMFYPLFASRMLSFSLYFEGSIGDAARSIWMVVLEVVRLGWSPRVVGRCFCNISCKWQGPFFVQLRRLGCAIRRCTHAEVLRLTYPGAESVLTSAQATGAVHG